MKSKRPPTMRQIIKQSFEAFNRKSSERDDKINQLLHDAEHADSGRMMARMMGDTAAEKELRGKHDRLIAEAQQLDEMDRLEALDALDHLEAEGGKS